MFNITTALKSGKKFKRKDAADWYPLKDSGNQFSPADLVAEDWITEDCLYKIELSVARLETIFAKINESSPTMGRGAFRELVLELIGVVIK